MPDEDRVTQVWLEEFKALRSEINLRTQLQHTTIVINLAQFGSLAAASVQFRNTNLALLIPFLSTSVALYWLNFHYEIQKVGLYIHEKIRTALSATYGHEVLLWEEWLKWESTKWERIRFGITIAMLFIIPNAVGLFLSAPVLTNWQDRKIFLWLGGLLVSLIALIIGIFEICTTKSHRLWKYVFSKKDSLKNGAQK